MYINHVAAEECRETDGFCPACNDFHPHIKASMEREEERRAANIKAGVKGTMDRVRRKIEKKAYSTFAERVAQAHRDFLASGESYNLKRDIRLAQEELEQALALSEIAQKTRAENYLKWANSEHWSPAVVYIPYL